MLDDFSSIDELAKPKSKSPANVSRLKVQKALSEVNRIFEEQEAAEHARVLGYDYVNLHGFPFDLEAMGLISTEQATQAHCVPFFHESGIIRIGVINPSDSNLQNIRTQLEKQKYEVKLYVVSRSSLTEGLEAYTRVVRAAEKGVNFSILNDTLVRQYTKEFEKHSALGPQAFEEYDASELVAVILSFALSRDASDIHFEPGEHEFKIRLRIDGVLAEIGSLPQLTFKKLISRFKIISHLKLNVTNLPQDGSFGLTLNGEIVDFRISILPSVHHEGAVIRILRQNHSANIDSLGLVGRARQNLEEVLHKTNGLILSTGPTGSGKTTTLYAILKKINRPGVKAITIEDPVEYKMDNVSQTSIDKAAGLTFASALKAMLRQDPDVVMVGEIRDHETAETAIQAALTGHVVLSTLHTNDAPSTIARLVDLDIKPFLIVGAINIIMAQRLVRKLCQECRQESLPDAELAQRALSLLETIPASSGVSLPPDKKFYTSKGCAACANLGYKGRIGIYEVLSITPVLETLILREASMSVLRQQAVSDGMLTMAQDGILKALNGITDIYEVFRVID